jgi:hypothetical protein
MVECTSAGYDGDGQISSSSSNCSPSGVSSADLMLTSDDVEDSESEDFVRLRIGSTILSEAVSHPDWNRLTRRNTQSILFADVIANF